MSDVRLRETINESYVADLFQNKHREIACYGGAAAGKSKAVAQKNVLRCLLYRHERIVVIRKTLPALKLTALRMIEETCQEWRIPYDLNRSDMTMHVQDGEFIFLSVVNTAGGAAERIKSLTDITAVWVEEGTELTEEEMTQISLRLRGRELEGGAYRQLITTFNPVDEGHWLHKWVEIDHRMQAVHKTYQDNRFLDPAYVATLEALKEQDENTYRVYAQGLWGALQNLIYHNYAVEEFDHPQSWYDFTGLGLDFGWENPSAAMFIGSKDTDLYIVDEVYRNHLTNAEFIKAIAEQQQSIAWDNGPVVGDAAEPARLEEIEQAGYEVYPADKAVADGITYVQGFRLHIHPRCVNCIREVQAYKHRVDRNGIVLEDPVKWMDHTWDAIRYFVYTFVRRFASGGGNV